MCGTKLLFSPTLLGAMNNPFVLGLTPPRPHDFTAMTLEELKRVDPALLTHEEHRRWVKFLADYAWEATQPFTFHC